MVHSATMPPLALAADPPPTRRCSPGAKHSRAHRVRQAHGLSVWRLTLPEYDCISYLIETGRIKPAEALNRLAVERAAADVFVDLARRWLAEKP